MDAGHLGRMLHDRLNPACACWGGRSAADRLPWVTAAMEVVERANADLLDALRAAEARAERAALSDEDKSAAEWFMGASLNRLQATETALAAERERGARLAAAVGAWQPVAGPDPACGCPSPRCIAGRALLDALAAYRAGGGEGEAS